MKKYFGRIILLISIVVVIIFVTSNSGQKDTKLKPESLNILKIAPVGKSVSEGITSDKYAFKTKDNGIIQIGTERHSPPKPYLQMGKWDGEVSLKVRMPFETGDNPTVIGNKLRYSTTDKETAYSPFNPLIPFSKVHAAEPRVDIDIYPREPDKQNEDGGVEFDTIFYEKPATNQIIFPIETQNLDFFYQPPLNQEQGTQNLEQEITCTETECKDKDGNIVNSRPENVVGSYAVYYKDGKSGDYSKMGGKNYKTGKAFHIYRPKVYDANSNSIWGILNVDTIANTLTVTVDQDWLNTAVYPVTVDPTFGYGGSGATTGEGYGYRGSLFTGSAGTLSSMSVYVGMGYATVYYAGVIYLHSDLSKIATTETKQSEILGGPLWKSLNFAGENISAVDYILTLYSGRAGGMGSNQIYIYYDSGSADQGHYNNTWTNTNPLVPLDTFPTVTHSTNKYSIYATYTSSATSTPTPAPVPTTVPGKTISDLQKGLVGHWKMDGNAKDFTSNVNHGTVTGATLTTDRRGQANKAYNFINGSTNNINIGNPTSLRFTSSFSVDGWMKIGDTNPNPLIAKDTGSAGDRGWYFQTVGSGSNQLRFLVSGDGTAISYLTTTNSLNLDQWYHLTAVYNSSTQTLKVYVNGIEWTGSLFGTVPASIYNSSQNVRIGASSSYTLGSIDDVRAYNRALSATEVADLYNEYNPGVVVSNLQKGLVGWWKFDGNAKDFTPNVNHGTVTGATLTTDRKGQVNKAYGLDGTSGKYINAGNGESLNPITAITIGLWAKPGRDYITEDNGWQGAFVIKSTNYYFGWGGWVDGIQYGVYKSTGVWGWTDQFVYPIYTDTWYHFLFTFDGRYLKCYINGALYKTKDIGTTDTIGTGAETVKIGYGSGSYFNGSIDDVRIYNRALSATEVRALYESY